MESKTISIIFACAISTNKGLLIYAKNPSYNLTKKNLFIMSISKHIFYITILFSSIFLLSSCDVKEVELVNIDSFNIVSIEKEDITIDVVAQIKNPNNFSFSITKVDLDIKFNNYFLGKINEIKKVSIKKNSNELQHLIFTFKLKDVMKGTIVFLPALLTNQANIEINGYVKASSFLMSKKIKVNYNKKTKISKE